MTVSGSGFQRWRDRLGGIWLFATMLCIGLGLASQRVANFDQGLSTLARMADSLRPQLLALAIPLSMGLGLFGLRRLAIAGVTLAMMGLCAIALDYHSRTAPSGHRSDLTLLWFNMLNENKVSATTLAQAIRNSEADVVVLSEATPIKSALASLRDIYPVQAGCKNLEECGLVILSRHPISRPVLRNMPTGPERQAAFQLRLLGYAPVALRAAHMTKPWYLGLTGLEQDVLASLLQTPTENGTPLIVVGDFNAGPWSAPMIDLERTWGLHHEALPHATWPVWSGGFGVPLDHVLVANGIRITDMSTWGNGLGSNHLGILARLELPQTSLSSTSAPRNEATPPERVGN